MSTPIPSASTKPVRPPLPLSLTPPATAPNLLSHGSVVLSADDMHDLSRFLSRNVFTPQDLIEAVKRLSLLNIEGLEITLEPRLLQRLKTRCVRGDFGPWLHGTIIRMLNSYAGI